MANESAKKRLRENAASLRWLLQVLLGAAALHAVFRLGLRTSSGWHKAAFGASLAASGAAYSFMRALSRATYGPQGELLDGGGDVSKSTSAQDVVYLVAIVHVLAIASPYAWLLLLAIPGAASLWLWRTVLSPYIFSPRDGEGDAPRGRGGRGAGKAERRGAKGTPRR